MPLSPVTQIYSGDNRYNGVLGGEILSSERSEGKKELVIDDYKIVSDGGTAGPWTRTRHLEITIIKLSPAGGSFIMSQPAHRCLYLRSNTLTLKTLGLSSKWHLSTLNTGGRAD